MLAGVLFVIAACCCWGLVFVVPALLKGFSPIEISLGRYLFFGIISLVLLINKRHLFSRSYFSIWIKAIWFAFMSTILSYTGVVFGICYADSAVTALIFGVSPITIALYGNWYRKEYSFKNFIIPGSVMLAGIVLVNLNSFTFEGNSFGLYLMGLLGAIIGLVSWTWYTVANFHFMEKNKNFPSNEWITMQGASTFFLVILATAIFIPLSPDLTKYFSYSKELQIFLIGSLILGTVSSWVGYFFWNCGNLRLPISIAGQLTIFEMIFGLLFSYLAEQRWPYPLEIAGIALMLAGVLTAFKTMKKLSSDKVSAV